MYEITLPVTREVFWLLATLVGIIAFSFVIYAALPRKDDGDDSLNIKDVLGAKKLSEPLFALLVVLWTVLAMCLFGGLVATIGKIAQLVIVGVETVEGKEARFPLIQLAALTATLGATVALPFTIIRLRLTHEQTATATASLFNQKITEAAADLHAQRQVTKDFDRKRETVWEDDVVRRNAAIDRLEGLVREEPQEAARVSRLLSVYVRELSDEIPAQPTPDTDDAEDMEYWAGHLRLPRSDMQNAVQVLGRLAKIKGVKSQDLEIDLRKANLQAMDLRGLSFEKANFSEANVEAAHFSEANLHGTDFFLASCIHANFRDTNLQSTSFSEANLTEAVFQGADLIEANFLSARCQRANFSVANLRGVDFQTSEMRSAVLIHAKLQGAVFRFVDMNSANFSYANLEGTIFDSSDMKGMELVGAKFSMHTILHKINLTGTSVRSADFSEVPEIQEYLPQVFGDSTTILPPDIPSPPHWSSGGPDSNDYFTQWREWAAGKGIQIPERGYRMG
ncbi:pentapeptide repeat-containing protein [uncultured Shimia sp.]|uniref:pentapeptide repeat-containing protein n=1 Tax=uncultured Shimia sp. TaxID=573152 RepID=UPI0025E729FD|nr:pentapeptide repeat-containing protein [uncultured Shimia sp.]